MGRGGERDMMMMKISPWKNRNLLEDQRQEVKSLGRGELRLEKVYDNKQSSEMEHLEMFARNLTSTKNKTWEDQPKHTGEEGRL